MREKRLSVFARGIFNAFGIFGFSFLKINIKINHNYRNKCFKINFGFRRYFAKEQVLIVLS